MKISKEIFITAEQFLESVVLSTRSKLKFQNGQEIVELCELDIVEYMYFKKCSDSPISNMSDNLIKSKSVSWCFGRRGTPVLIPNTEVKLSRTDGTP